MKKLKCINADVGGLTLDKVYDIDAATTSLDDVPEKYVIVIDDDGTRSMYEASRFIVVPDWDKISDFVSGFVGWADPESENPFDPRYAISINPVGVHKWVRVRMCSDDNRTSYIWSTHAWYGPHGIKAAQTSALEHKKTYKAS